MTGTWADLEAAAATWAIRHPDALEYAEDFTREHRATMRDALGRAILTAACRQATVAGCDRGGPRCCGTTGELHRPWCRTGPRRSRPPTAGGAPQAGR